MPSLRKRFIVAWGYSRPASTFYAYLMALILILGVSPRTIAETPVGDAIAHAQNLKAAGQFTDAANVLKQMTAENVAPADQKKINFELDQLERIRLDYSLTRDKLFADLQDSVRDLKSDEFDQWIRQGRFDSRQIDGQQWFMNSSVSNLFFRYPELNSRRLNAEDGSAVDQEVLSTCRAIKSAARQSHSPYVLPRRIDATMTVTANADITPPDAIIRAWLPIPHDYPYQSGFELVGSSPPPKEIAPGNSPIRSVYFEQPAQSGKPTRFQLHFRYTHFGVSFDIDPKTVVPFDGKDPSIAPFIREAPHVVFTPQMRALSQQIVGDEKNPARAARKIYDWIAANIHYSFATEYSTIPNISDYVLTHRYGDCGEEAMFFITLCRLNGIPARWQTGWDIFPGKLDIHDWSEIYLKPYGWIPVDPCMGLLSARYMSGLSPAERQELHDFYFGGLDQWRMAANSDHCQLLTPPKNSFRSDNVDFQRGELESAGQNIYFNHYHYQIKAKEVTQH
ncbi:MAG TPA: transglutaminase-like domain-containing protein [Tepidisphaeraceae bacterium]